ncbi:pyruvate dehydrogenase (acetyl-transferring) E1 component subunit alpha [Nocardioides zeae]|uniref:Pyruvate dehydrogenase (Acetyl-transferring) E1 component subunit alpha n=1 Tax=Nocardioides imazamoxiresistens TaxID=3231893 RepID=A0ABU3PVM2_9ACTN|nr:pyruvate dehydrogenase (acetyl-transferring) E1 component subunit alpha [Nocardioides zeae]MDT9593289.1 pyruvate dehydrogenase (acetyl-transferring) E1 component subunit alpha [Nocardioides zeae]
MTILTGAPTAHESAECEPDYVQLLTPEGARTEHPDYAFDGDDDLVRTLHRDMVLVRRIDTEATALQRHGELGIWAQLLGQEAAQVGAAHGLRRQDFVFPTYREHGMAWVRGIDPGKLLGLFRGVDHGGWDPAEHDFGLYTIVIGAQTLHATGYAMAQAADGLVGSGDVTRDACTVAHFGDGASSQGDVLESFVFAATYDAPVVFYCQNNQWAISSPIERQSRTPLHWRAPAFGFPGVRVDGNDALATYAVMRAATDRARSGEGPMFVEAYTYRMGAHTTTDDPTRYRAGADVDAWRRKDPIARTEAYLRSVDAIDDAWVAGLEQEAADLGADLRRRCRELPDPEPLALFDHVYAESTPEIEEQREGYAAYLAQFDTTGTEVAR